MLVDALIGIVQENALAEAYGRRRFHKKKNTDYIVLCLPQRRS